MRPWMRLDNAALIFPATQNSRWVNTFRLSADLAETVDPALLGQAVRDLMPRFPTVYVRLGRGLFWYYLQAVDKAPDVIPEYAYPLTHMSRREQKRCCFRVLYHENRIAVEFFHAITDGTGGEIFLKSLVARYLELRYGVPVETVFGIRDRRDAPTAEERRDAFQTYTGDFPMSRREDTVYRLFGTPDATGFMHVITGIVPTGELIRKAREYGATVTGFLAAVMLKTIIGMQEGHVRREKRRPVKVTIPINLRKVFGADTLRNFALVLNIGVDPRLKDYSLADLCREYRHQMDLENTPERMAARIAANVLPARNKLLRIAPLFIKNIAMRSVYNRCGERKGCINISNLGSIALPEGMRPYVTRVDFMIGVQLSYPNNCSVASCGDVTTINMIRNIRETELERRFFSELVRLGIPVSVESNDP